MPTSSPDTSPCLLFEHLSHATTPPRCAGEGTGATASCGADPMGTRLRAGSVRADRPGWSDQVDEAAQDQTLREAKGRAFDGRVYTAARPSLRNGILDIAPREDRYISHMPISLDIPCSTRKPHLHISSRSASAIHCWSLYPSATRVTTKLAQVGRPAAHGRRMNTAKQETAGARRIIRAHRECRNPGGTARPTERGTRPHGVRQQGVLKSWPEHRPDSSWTSGG